MPVAMKLHASLVVQLLPVLCHPRLSPTALLSDSCNRLAGSIASRIAARREPASAEVTVGVSISLSLALTAPIIHWRSEGGAYADADPHGDFRAGGRPAGGYSAGDTACEAIAAVGQQRGWGQV